MSQNPVPYDPSWPRLYATEKARLLKTLGFCTEGGVVYQIEQVGATSVPGMTAVPLIEAVIDAYPYPLPPERVAAMERAGYRYLGQSEDRQSFRKGDAFQVEVVSFEGEGWSDAVLLRNYLRASADAAERFSALRGQPDAELRREAYAWHIHRTGFKPLEVLRDELEGLDALWMVSSGWALDLFMNAPSRYHHDLDITIWREDQTRLQRHLEGRGWQMHKIVSQGQYALWETGEFLQAPVHQIHARRGEDNFLDILISPRQGSSWVYRRNPSVKIPIAQARMESRGIPHLAPEVVLLFKSGSAAAPTKHRNKDQQDFERVLPALPKKRRLWLKETLLELHPTHPWLDQM